MFFQLTPSSSPSESREGLSQRKAWDTLTEVSPSGSQAGMIQVWLAGAQVRLPCVRHDLLALVSTVHRAAASTMHPPLPSRRPPHNSHPGSQGFGVTHWASNIGRVVHTRRPLVCAITVRGDESVLLGISRTAVDLVFPAWLRRTFYP